MIASINTNFLFSGGHALPEMHDNSENGTEPSQSLASALLIQMDKKEAKHKIKTDHHSLFQHIAKLSSGKYFFQLCKKQLLPEGGMSREQHHHHPLHQVPHGQLVVILQALKDHHRNMMSTRLVEAKQAHGRGGDKETTSGVWEKCNRSLF